MSSPLNQFRLIRFAELDSTNSYASRNLRTLGDGDVVLTEKQTAGRGRMGRTWVGNQPGNIYATLVLKPSAKLDPSLPLVNLTQYFSVVLCRLLQEYGVEASIKWPNDVQVQGRKICGILSECRITGAELQGVLIGMGINLNMPPEVMEGIDQPATALNLLLGGPVDQDLFLTRLLEGFFAGYPSFLGHGFPSIAKEYRSLCPGLGRFVTLNLLTRAVRGVAERITEGGALELRLENGQNEVFTLGEVTEGWS